MMVDRDSNAPRDTRPEHPNEPVCSFCGKGRDKVCKLIAGPKVHICDECIELCNDIVAEEYESAVEVKPSDQPAMFLLAADCALCHLPTPIGELVPIPERGYLCAVCLEAVRLARLTSRRQARGTGL